MFSVANTKKQLRDMSIICFFHILKRNHIPVLIPQQLRLRLVSLLSKTSPDLIQKLCYFIGSVCEILIYFSRKLQFLLCTLAFTKSSSSAHDYHLDAPWRNTTSLGLSQFQHCVPPRGRKRAECIKDENAKGKNSSGKEREEHKS